MSSISSLQEFAELQADLLTIPGHPATPLFDTRSGEIQKMVTVCCECGSIHSIIMLVDDRWYCSRCRMSGSVSRNARMFPIS